MAEDSTTLSEWMADQINRAIPDDGDWTTIEVAEKLVARLEETEPARFGDWMRENTFRFLRDTINTRRRSYRARAMRQAKKARFSDAAAAFEAGDTTALDPYRIDFSLDDTTGVRKYLGEMTGNECGRAAAQFERRTADNELRAKFLRGLERKCGRKKVKNVYSREQLAAMFDSLGLELS